ncbi:MAG: hypothetical protein V7606_4625, partial [Burkholderiales bacterium]
MYAYEERPTVNINPLGSVLSRV